MTTPNLKILEPQNSALAIRKCINNKFSLTFEEDESEQLIVYDCLTCNWRGFICEDCIEFCHKIHIPNKNNLTTKVIKKKGFECHCAKEDHMVSSKSLKISFHNVNKENQLGECPSHKLYDALDFNYIWKANKYKAKERAKDFLPLCQYCVKNCILSANDRELYTVHKAEGLHCQCQVIHDDDIVNRTNLELIISNPKIPLVFDKAPLFGKVVLIRNILNKGGKDSTAEEKQLQTTSKDEMLNRVFLNMFKGFGDGNRDILKAPHLTPQIVEKVINNTYNQVLKILSGMDDIDNIPEVSKQKAIGGVDNVEKDSGASKETCSLTDINKKICFDIGNQNMAIRMAFLDKALIFKMMAVMDLDPEITCNQLSKLLYFYRFWILYPKLKIKNLKTILKDRENVSPLHSFFLKDSIEKFYASIDTNVKKDPAESEQNFKLFMQNYFDQICRLMRVKHDLRGLPNFVKQFLNLIELMLCYKISEDTFKDLCTWILKLLKNDVNQKLFRSKDAKLREDIRRIFYLLSQNINEIKFFKYFEEGSLNSYGYSFQINDTAKTLLQIIYFGKNDHFQGGDVYDLFLKTEDIFIETLNSVLDSTPYIFSAEMLDVFNNTYNFIEESGLKEDLLVAEINGLNQTKNNYLCGNINSDEMLKQIYTYLNLIYKKVSDNLSLISKNSKFKRQMYLLKNGCYDIFEFYKLIIFNKHLMSREPRNEAELNDEIESIFHRILSIFEKLTEDNSFLSLTFFSEKIVKLLYRLPNKNVFLRFYKNQLKICANVGCKIHVTHLLKKLNEISAKAYAKNFHIKTREPITRNHQEINETMNLILDIYNSCLVVYHVKLEEFLNYTIVHDICQHLTTKFIYDKLTLYIENLEPTDSIKKLDKSSSDTNVITLLFKVIDKISNNYMYVLSSRLPVAKMEQILRKFNKLDPKSRMVIQNVYTKLVIKFPYKVVNSIVQESVQPFYLNDFINDNYNSNNNIEANDEPISANNYEIIIDSLANFREIIGIFERDYFKNNPKLLLNFFMKVVFIPSL